jgi:hypothetical protein
LLIEYDRRTAETGGNTNSEDELSKTPPNKSLVLIHTGANLGFAGGNNVGIEYAMQSGADYIWLLNNDAVMDADALTELIKLSENNPSAGMLGSKILSAEDPTQLEAAGGGKNMRSFVLGFSGGYTSADSPFVNKVSELDYVIGASLLVRTNTIGQIGLMDESYFFFSEEIDWNIRAKKAGWKLLYCPQSTIYHKGSSSIQKASPLRDYYFVRNNLKLIKKFFPYLLPLAIIRSFIRMAKRLKQREMQNVKSIIIAMRDFFIGRDGMYKS